MADILHAVRTRLDEAATSAPAVSTDPFLAISRRTPALVPQYPHDVLTHWIADSDERLRRCSLLVQTTRLAWHSEHWASPTRRGSAPSFSERSVDRERWGRRRGRLALGRPRPLSPHRPRRIRWTQPRPRTCRPRASQLNHTGIEFHISQGLPMLRRLYDHYEHLSTTHCRPPRPGAARLPRAAASGIAGPPLRPTHSWPPPQPRPGPAT